MNLKLTIYCALLLSVIGVTVYAFHENYFVETKAYGDVTILWNEKEAFLFVGKEINGFAGSRSGFLIESLTPMRSLVTDTSSDIIIIHLDTNECSIYNQHGLNCAGNPFIFRGKLYFATTVNHGEKFVLWKWSGVNFVEVEADAARKILSSFTLFDDLLKKEGWKEIEASFTTRGTNILLSLQPVSYDLIINRIQDAKNEDRVMLQNYLVNGRRKELVNIPREIRQVTKAEYENQFPLHVKQ